MQTKFQILHETLLPLDIATKEVLAINEEVYDALVNSLLKEDKTKIAQPNLIVGEAGCGKTFLIKKLFDAIEKDIRKTLYPIAIEGKSLYSTDGIWAQCASRLDIEGPIDDFNDILEWQERNSKRIVLLIDNIQYYFKRTNNPEHYKLRSKLNRSGAPILIGSSDKVLKAFTDYNAAFFDGFRIIYFKPISIPAVSTIIKQYDMVRLKAIMSYLPQTIRSIFIAIEILEKTDDSRKDPAFLSDYFHSHYQNIFDSSALQSQRILTALSQADTGLNLAEIREKTQQENGKISPYLKLMTDKKTLKKEAKTSRGAIYSITDPLFKLWLRHNI